MSFIPKVSGVLSGYASKVAAKSSKLLNSGVKAVSKNGDETVTTMLKTGTKVMTYDDKALKIVEFGKNSDMRSKFGLNSIIIVPKGSKRSKNGMILSTDFEGKTKKYSLQEFGNWMKCLRDHMKKYNLNATFIDLK